MVLENISNPLNSSVLNDLEGKSIKQMTGQ